MRRFLRARKPSWRSFIGHKGFKKSSRVAKTDSHGGVSRLVSYLALFISLASIVASGSSVVNYWRGADVQMIAPEKAMIFFRSGGAPCDECVNIGITRMTYLNQGAPGYGALIEDERVIFHSKGISRELDAEEVGILDWKKPDDRLRDGSDAGPFIVPGAEIASREVRFAPREDLKNGGSKNFVTRDEFIAEVNSGKNRGENYIRIEVEAKVTLLAGFNSGKKCLLSADCYLTLDGKLIEWLDRAGVASRTCQIRKTSMHC